MAVRETVDASKVRFEAHDLRQLFAGATQVVVAKGKKLVVFDLERDLPAPQDLARVALGPSGKLRAPAVRCGTKWLIGFHPEAYAEHFD